MQLNFSNIPLGRVTSVVEPPTNKDISVLGRPEQEQNVHGDFWDISICPPPKFVDVSSESSDIPTYQWDVPKATAACPKKKTKIKAIKRG